MATLHYDVPTFDQDAFKDVLDGAALLEDKARLENVKMQFNWDLAAHKLTLSEAEEELDQLRDVTYRELIKLGEDADDDVENDYESASIGLELLHTSIAEKTADLHVLLTGPKATKLERRYEVLVEAHNKIKARLDSYLESQNIGTARRIALIHPGDDDAQPPQRVEVTS